jgi:hypothetical protein
MARLFNVTLLFCLLFVALPIDAGFSQGAEGVTGYTPVSGKVTFGPFQFNAPEGYVYAPRTFPQKGLGKNEHFLVTFFSKEDIPPEDMRGYRQKNVIFNFYVFMNTFQNAQDYYDKMSEAYRLSGTSESDISSMALPEETQPMFNNAVGWSCRKEVLRGYPPMHSINCVMLQQYGVIITVFGDEKAVSEKASVLRDMISSFATEK